MHAVARLALHPLITNIQASWVKLGIEGAQAALQAGANDLGGTLMNEWISRAAGAAHGQEMPPSEMEAAIRAMGRRPQAADDAVRPSEPGAPAAAPTLLRRSPSRSIRSRQRGTSGRPRRGSSAPASAGTRAS